VAVSKAKRTRYKLAIRAIEVRILGGAQVIIATCMIAGYGILTHLSLSYGYVILNEACSCHPMDALMGVNLDPRQILWAGVPQQLGPTLSYRDHSGVTRHSDIASLMERSLTASFPRTFLDHQFRMHSAILVFPSSHFYPKAIHDGIKSYDRPPFHTFTQSVLKKNRLFINHTSLESSTRPGPLLNDGELHIIITLLMSLVLKFNYPLGDIRVMAMYEAQVVALNTALEQVLPAQAAAIPISTTNGFQAWKDLSSSWELSVPATRPTSAPSQMHGE
jgi:hypothetical protein